MSDYPEKIYATEKVGTSGIHCLDYRNFDDDVEYVIVKPKRKPLPDGRLPMTDDELLEFNQLMELTEIKKVFIKNGFIYYTFLDLDIILSDVKAILYLANLFDLEV